MRAGICIAPWKREIFERHFLGAGYTFETPPCPMDGVLIIIVITDNAEALAEVVAAAQAEAVQTKGDLYGSHHH